MLTIDKKLNLVVPIDCADGVTRYVHSMPISREVFKRNFVLLGRVFNATYAQGLGIAGPRLIMMTLERIANDMGQWDATQAGLLAEIRRMTNFIEPRSDGSGYGVVPWTDASRAKIISEADAEEVENAITFFTVASHMNKKNEWEAVDEALGLWGAQMSSSTPMEYSKSLTTSMQDAVTGPNLSEPTTQDTAPPSSIAY